MSEATSKPDRKRSYYDNLNTEQCRTFKIGVAWIMGFLAASLLSYVGPFVYMWIVPWGPWCGLIIPLLWIGVTGIGLRAGITVIHRRLDRTLPNPRVTREGSLP
jgi:hypothetical protein